MNSEKIGADGWTGGRTEIEGSIRGPRGPKNTLIPVLEQQKMLTNQVQDGVVPNRRSDLSLSFQRWTTEGCNSQRLHDAGTNN